VELLVVELLLVVEVEQVVIEHQDMDQVHFKDQH
tara:strand:+ start:783 stop:884 length:102 start_codon:yes stop_codon:yes gene_type:complete